MIKLIALYMTYFIILFVIYSSIGFGLINGEPLRNIIGIIIFVLLSGWVGLITKQIITQNKINNLKTISVPKEKSPLEELEEYESYFKSFVYHDLNQHKCIEQIDKMRTKYLSIDRLLSENFSVNDLTYATYKNGIDEVLRVFNKNTHSIVKRFKIYDKTSETAKVYLSEIDTFFNNNNIIVDRMDKLQLELVRLDDYSQLSTSTIENLISQTHLYKNEKEINDNEQ